MFSARRRKSSGGMSIDRMTRDFTLIGMAAMWPKAHMRCPLDCAKPHPGLKYAGLPIDWSPLILTILLARFSRFISETACDLTFRRGEPQFKAFDLLCAMAKIC